MVVQLPMFNEREVCQNVIDACCEMTWPREKLLVQVLAPRASRAAAAARRGDIMRRGAARAQILDDSTDAVTRERIEDKARPTVRASAARAQT